MITNSGKKKKKELFERTQTWGRETFEYTNPEETRSEGTNATRKRRPGDVGWGVQGTHGGRGDDNGILVMQRGEVDQQMEKNEKGLWVQKKPSKEVSDRELSPVPEGGWRCPKCKQANPKTVAFCKACSCDPSMYAQYKARPGEDPRVEGAKPKGRGTSDAQAKALQALEARRNQDRELTGDMVDSARRKAAAAAADDCRSKVGRDVGYVPLNSSGQQLRPARRNRKYDQRQGVQRTDEDAVRVVGKAVGGATIGKEAMDAAKPIRIEDSTTGAMAGKRKERSPSPFAWESPSPSRSRSRSQDAGAAPTRASETQRGPSPRSLRLRRATQPEGGSTQRGPSPRSRRLGRSSQTEEQELAVDFF